MDIEKLRNILLNENAHDKRESFWVAELVYCFFFLIILLLAIFFVSFFYYTDLYTFLKESYSRQKIIPIFISFLLMLGFILFPIYYMKAAKEREKLIDRLVVYMREGSKAHTFSVKKKYKIYKPLGIGFFKFFPVTVLHFYLDKDNRPFNLPVREPYINDLELVLKKGIKS